MADVHHSSTSELESRAAKLVDPGVVLKVKLQVATEIKDILDTLRDSESGKVLPQMVPSLIDLLRNGQPQLKKEHPEFKFRRVLLEIIGKLPHMNNIQQQYPQLAACLLHVMRTDCDEHAVLASKSLNDVLRTSRLTEELLVECVNIFKEIMGNAQAVVNECLSDNSAVVDTSTATPSLRSFRMLAEMAGVIVFSLNSQRPLITPLVRPCYPLALAILQIESQTQKRAREDFEAMGSYWSGMAPEMKNPQVYNELITAQTKIMVFFSYVTRLFSEPLDTSSTESVLLAALRIWQDCQANNVSTRKELMMATRNLVQAGHRPTPLLSQIDKLYDERVLLGTATNSREILRPSAYTTLADITHHLKAELSPHQIIRVVYVYSRLLQDPTFSSNSHTLFAKMLCGLGDSILSKEPPPVATKLLTLILETSVSRLEALDIVQQEVISLLTNAKKGGKEIIGPSFIERSRPLGGSAYAVDKGEEVLVESKNLFRNLLHCFRVSLSGLRKASEGRPMDLDGTLVFRMFEGCMRCLAEYEQDRPNEMTDPVEWFSPVLYEVNLHIFQEVWTHKIDLYFQTLLRRPYVLSIAQQLFNRESCSPTLLAIVLRYLIDRLPLLGEEDESVAVTTIRLFKIAFGAVSIHPVPNEPILASYLARLLTDCFSFAAKATKPMNYFILLRTLFRSIGGGGGRFELLYPEVLPLLPEMLESLNRQLLASDGVVRDTIVELCLTVPLRLTHLLPHLTYLMHPLALSLRGSTELVAQGLRTLELFIDNLTPDFLDPTLNQVLRELMEALHSHLRPVPSNHHAAHTTIRILGKLGGRNRRLLAKPQSFKYHDHSPPTTVTISFGAGSDEMDISTASMFAAQIIAKGSPAGRSEAYEFLENCVTVIVNEGIKGRNTEDVFLSCMEALFNAMFIPDLQEKANVFVRKISADVFKHQHEFRPENLAGMRQMSAVSPLLARYLDALPRVLARENPVQAKAGEAFVTLVLQDLINRHTQQSQGPLSDIFPILSFIATRFTALCLEDTWLRKSAGCTGIKIMALTPEFGEKWVAARELDVIRTLLHILKDLPPDLPRDIDNVIDVMKRVLRMTNDATVEREARDNKYLSLAGAYSLELQNANPVVRDAARIGISLLAELSDKTPVELLAPHRTRLLQTIYTKPLRALPFAMQIGMIEAIRYCMELGPPLIELNDELLRLLHETLALADADDDKLLPRAILRQSAIEIVKLRVACIKLLTASMPLTEFFARQNQTRQRVISVYFKSLYSTSLDVKSVAHEGLAMVLLHQSRLPKELLQTGLRPILMNLADPKRLSIPGLEALARLLKLLTNYFKVEIGHKLLDHFRIVADPQMLVLASRSSLGDNEGITKLVRLANIFHLLPSAANVFLESLINSVVQIETTMHFSSCSPFSEPLAKYLDRYPHEGTDHFLRHLQHPRALRTLRSIFQAKLAPNLLQVFASRTGMLALGLIRRHNAQHITPTLHLFNDFADLVPFWILENEIAIQSVLTLWWADVPSTEAEALPDLTQRHSLILPLFIKALKGSPRVDLLFDLVAVFTRDLAIDPIHTSHFLYNHVALSNDIIFRRNVLMRFLTWFDDPSISWQHKTACIRYLITPIFLVHAKQCSEKDKDALLDSTFIDRIHRAIWTPLSTPAFLETDDLFKIEILHLTTVLVEHYSVSIEQAKKDIIKGAWYFIESNDDMIVKQTAFLLAARFYAVYPAPPKHILKAWMGLLKPPQVEGKGQLRSEILSVLSLSLPESDPGEAGPPAWAKNTRRLLTEDGPAQYMSIYHLFVKMPNLFYPVRALFVPHMVNAIARLALSSSTNLESRILCLEVLRIFFDWDQKAATVSADTADSPPQWRVPIGFRESVVSSVLRMASYAPELPIRQHLIPRALTLLQRVVSRNGWPDVTVGLRFFIKSLETNEFNADLVPQAISAGRVLQIVAADQDDAWYTGNHAILTKLVKKGMCSDDSNLHEALYPIFDRLVKLYPLPKDEDKTRTPDVVEFHSFIFNTITDCLGKQNLLRGTLLMLKSVVQADPERIEPFGASLLKLLGKSTKEHIVSAPNAATFENGVRIIITILDICQTSIAFLADQRKFLLSTLTVMVAQSKSQQILRHILDMTRKWVLGKQDSAPSMKDKAALLQKMIAFERSDAIFHAYLELVYEIYTEPTLRRSELTLRLEASFLLGCRARDPTLRGRFMELFDLTIPRSLHGRLTYILGVQSWEALQSDNWIYLALYLLLGAADVQAPLLKTVTDSSTINSAKLEDVVRPLQRLCFLDRQTASDTWISVFPIAWASLSRREQGDITFHMIQLLSKEYHIKQAEIRPNVVLTLLTGIHACSPPMALPPHLVKYLAKTYGAWHIGLELLGVSLDLVRDDDRTTREYVFDSLADVYAELSEEDLFYGIWRRRSQHNDTNQALAFEQNGMWDQAAAAYEAAQAKSRQGAIPFSESEFCLWEDHWMLSAEKLQHWDLLYDLAKSDENQELMLESAWRIKDWAETRDALELQIQQLPEVPTPRRRVFEAFIALLKMPGAAEKNTDFTKILEDAMQLSLRKWVSLPPHLSTAHVPILQHFQQFVELQEAVQIFGSLAVTNVQNLEKKSSELKMVLQAWRERLPNVHDDISIWSDLVAWRQNVFGAINKAYLPLINSNPPGGATSAGTNTFGYRGYHETAWIINRFAHVARKHDLLDVCFSSLNKIYTLPNIEISEAFLKLREQARCHYQRPNDLHAGLEVINNTNLIYFTTAQKAEFYTLKGMFHARFGRNDEANVAFGQAVQLDMAQAKAWAEWGKYNDSMFKETPVDMSKAASAVSCYLQAAGVYKNGKSRPLLARILWLLSVDDNSLTISRAFDTYKGDAAYWFWITLIPQLCQSISHREVKQARYILLGLAKLYPQALFYQLRTTQSEMLQARKMADQAKQRAAIQARAAAAAAAPNTDVEMADGTATTNGAVTANEVKKDTDVIMTPANVPQNHNGGPPPPNSQEHPPRHPQPWETIEEVVQILKTAFPLLILSMENMIDQLTGRFKSSAEDDAYRNICMVLSEGLQHYIVRANNIDDDGLMPPGLLLHIRHIAQHLYQNNQPHKDFIEDFQLEVPDATSKITGLDFVHKMQRWRSRYEKVLHLRPRYQSLDGLSHYLTEFQYNKIDEIEVPGQYTEDKLNNQNFLRIQKFSPKFENCLSNGLASKRVTIHANDSSRTSFVVQFNPRFYRREEKAVQMFRTFNGALSRKKESRKRNLSFHLPASVSCSNIMRLYQTDSSYVTLGDVFDLHCAELGISREEPFFIAGAKTKQVLTEFKNARGRRTTPAEYFMMKKEILDEIAAKIIPEDVLSRYMARTMQGPSELWRMRKEFALQTASASFMTYVFCLAQRNPHRFQVSRATGQIAVTDITPSPNNHMPVFHTPDVVPFRLTPNMQHFIGPVLAEGVLTSGIMTIGRCLTEPEFDLEQQLCLYSRDEVIAWMQSKKKPWTVDFGFRQAVVAHSEDIVKRAEAMGCKVEREQAFLNPGNQNQTVVQTVTNLISTATNPLDLAKMGDLFYPWF